MPITDRMLQVAVPRFYTAFDASPPQRAAAQPDDVQDVIVSSWGLLRLGDLPGRLGMDAKLLHDALRHASLPVVREDELGARFAEAAHPPKAS